MARVLVAMSGGVDSSVAALLCVKAGHEAIGVTMDLWPAADEETAGRHEGCCSLAAVQDARRACALLGIPHYVVNFRERFKQTVIADFCAAYARGLTPNPCVVCNRVIKFEHLLHKALELEAEYLVTGHYARISRNAAGRYELRKASYLDKDQSYALYGLTQMQLAHTLFPLGAYPKAEVRRMAEAAGLPAAARPESQDVCFVMSGSYREFLEAQGAGGLEPGPIVDSRGNLLGHHDGIANYTVGQRKGLGITAPEPMYVLEIRAEERSVVVGPEGELTADALVAEDCNWVSIEPPEQPLRAEVKIRYGAPPVACTVVPGAADGTARVSFDEPQRAVTPGQAAVWYNGDLVLGGGTIITASRAPRGCPGSAGRRIGLSTAQQSRCRPWGNGQSPS